MENRTHTSDSRRGSSDFCLFTSSGISELDAEYTVKDGLKNTSTSLQNKRFGAARDLQNVPKCASSTSETLCDKEQISNYTKNLNFVAVHPNQSLKKEPKSDAESPLRSPKTAIKHGKGGVERYPGSKKRESFILKGCTAWNHCFWRF